MRDNGVLPLADERSTVVPSYRLYHMRPRDRHIDRFEDFDAANDEAALIFAKNKLDGHPLELWEGHRKVHRLDLLPLENHVSKVWSQRRGISPHLQSPEARPGQSDAQLSAE